MAYRTMLLVVLATACTDELPSYQRVVDMRLLAMRADPPAFLVGNPLTESAESLDMSFSALVLDPRGGPIEYTWSFCPVESGRACRDYEDRRAEADPSQRPALDSMREDLALATATALPIDEVTPPPDDEFAERGTWRYAVGDYAFTAPPTLHTYHFFDSALGLGLGAWPSAVLSLERPGEQLLAAKRAVVGLRDLRGAAESLAGEIDATLCPGNDPEPGCLVVRDPTANTNPVFAGVQIAQGEEAFDADFEDIPIGPDGTVAGPIGVRGGEAIRIRPIIEQNEQADASDWRVHPEYHYQSFRIDLENEQLFVNDLFEEVSISWFVTGGTIGDALTWPKFTKTLDTVWSAPPAPPADTDGRVTVWMVARDQRGGVAWMSVEILVLALGG